MDFSKTIENFVVKSKKLEDKIFGLLPWKMIVVVVIILLGIKINNIESDVSSIKRDVSSIESDVSSIESDVSSIKYR